MNQTMQTTWIALSTRLYRTLLILYPADYRREYGGLMVQVFRDVCRAKYQQYGWAAVALWWCTTLLDLALTVIEQRRKVKFAMSKSAFAQMAGLLLIVGGSCCAIAAFSQLQPDSHQTYSGVFQVLMLLSAPGLVLVGLGCIGLGLRYEAVHDTVAQWTLYLSGIGAIVMGVGVVGMFIEETLRNVWFGGGILHAVALIAFGFLHLRKPTLPIFRALPLQLGGGWLVLMLGVLRTDSELFNNALSFLLFIGMGLAWLAIGMAMNRQQPETVPAAT
jgi:hypothetical protein